jgi:Nucleoside 2-deoxyribosyltransferase like
MRVVQCPAEAEPRDGERSLFLAGGISNCPDWQSELLELLSGTDWLLINPRRGDFDSINPAMTEAQIAWEHWHLRLAGAIAFWFPPQTLCPITLYELGAWSMTPKPLFIGVDPQYKRRLDVLEQTRLVRPDVRVVDSLEGLAAQLIGGAR